MSAIFLSLASSRGNITTSGQKKTVACRKYNVTKPEKTRCLFQQFMSSIPKNIKMHHFHTCSAIKSSTTPVFLCQEGCTVKILRVYSVKLLPLLPLHGNSFPNFLSSPLVAILPQFLTKTPVSLN